MSKPDMFKPEFYEILGCAKAPLLMGYKTTGGKKIGFFRRIYLRIRFGMKIKRLKPIPSDPKDFKGFPGVIKQ